VTEHASFPSMLDPEPLHPETVRPLRRKEFERLVELGSFEDERIELLEGVLVRMNPQRAAHASVVSRLGQYFGRVLADRAVVRQHSPLALSDDSEPEPDVALVAPGDYARAHPAAALLVVEVSESSLRKDREVKAAVYAAAGVPEYWIVNLVDRVFEVHRGPRPRERLFASVTTHDATASVSPLAFPDVIVAVGDFV